MKDYYKVFSYQYDINPIIDYYAVNNGIYILYIDGKMDFEEIKEEEEKKIRISQLEEIIKFQDFILFDKVYKQDYLFLLGELEADYELLRTKVKYPAICLTISIALMVNLFLVPSFTNLVFVIANSVLGRRLAIGAKKMNKIVGAEEELVKRVKFIDEEEELNKAIEEQYLLILEGVMEMTKLVINNNLKNDLPAITMNNISNISLKDLDTMISNMHYNRDNNLLELNITNEQENSDDKTYSYKYNPDKNNDNINNEEEYLTETKPKTKIRKKDN